MSPPLCHSWRTDSQCRLRHVCWGNKTPCQLLCFLFCVTVFPPRVLVFSFSLWLTAHALPPSDLTFWLFSSFIILSGFSPSFGLFHSLHIFPASTVLRQKHLQPLFLSFGWLCFPWGFCVKRCLWWLSHQGSPCLPLSLPLFLLLYLAFSLLLFSSLFHLIPMGFPGLNYSL